MLWLSLSILIVGLVRIRIIPITVANGAPIDETFHFGWVLDTVTALSSKGIQLQTDFQQTHPSYPPQGSLHPYSLFQEYWRGIGVYLPQAIVQLVVPISSMAERIYLARFVNLCFEVILACTAYVAMSQATPNRRIALTASILLSFIPTLSTSAATVTPEVPAFTACLLLFIALAQLYKNGWSFKTVFWLALGCLSCLLTKNTSWPVIGVIAILILRRAGLPWRVFLLGGAGLVIAAATQLRPEGAAHWYREHLPWEAWGSFDTFLAPVDLSTSKLGRNSLLISNVQEDRPIIQNLSVSSLSNIRGQTVTIGSWVRAPVGTPILLPIFQPSQDGFNFTILPGTENTIVASGDWQFAQYQLTLPVNLTYARISLRQTPNTQTPIQYDGLVLAIGSFSKDGRPQFSNEAATQGIWNENTFVNQLRNGSAESQWWGVDSAKWTKEYPVNQRLFALQDWERTWSGYIKAARAVFVTLWGSFQNDIPGLTPWQDASIGLILAIGLGGLLLRIMQQSQSRPLPVPKWVLECWILWILVYLLIAFVRSDVSGAWTNSFFSATGRFIIPVLFPFLGLSLIGLDGLQRQPYRNWTLAGLVAFMFLLNLWMLLKVELPYYNCTALPRWICIASLY